MSIDDEPTHKGRSCCSLIVSIAQGRNGQGERESQKLDTCAVYHKTLLDCDWGQMIPQMPMGGDGRMDNPSDDLD